MKWTACRLYKLIETGKDELNNPTYSSQMVAEVGCRYTPIDDILAALGLDNAASLNPRNVTKDERFFTIAGGKASLPDFDYVEVNGRDYKIQEIIDLGPRWAVLRGVVYGN